MFQSLLEQRLTDETPGTTKRRPGAPRGNRNAFKHGRYSAEVLDLRRRMMAFRRRANAACAAANRLTRATTEAEREKARAEVRAAVRGEGGRAKTARNRGTIIFRGRGPGLLAETGTRWYCLRAPTSLVRSPP